MPAPDVHTEDYKVNSVSPRSFPTRLELAVTMLNTSGDDPVEQIIVYKGLPSGGSNLCGAEWPEDNIASVYMDNTTYANAAAQIQQNWKVGYLSSRVSGVEKISLFSWRSA